MQVLYYILCLILLSIIIFAMFASIYIVLRFAIAREIRKGNERKEGK